MNSCSWSKTTDINTFQKNYKQAQDLIFAYLNSSQEQIPTTDVTIFCSDGALPCHRLVLASLSKMLYSILIEHSSDEKVNIILPEFNTAEVQTFFESLFTERKVNTNNSLNDLFGLENLGKYEEYLLLKTEPIEKSKVGDTYCKDEDHQTPDDNDNFDAAVYDQDFDSVKDELNEIVTIKISNKNIAKNNFNPEESLEDKFVTFRDVNNKKRYKCNFCEYSTPGRWNIRRHVNTLHCNEEVGADKYTCQHCGKIFRGEPKYLSHLQNAHGEEKQKYYEQNNIEETVFEGVRRFQCKLCEYSSPRCSIIIRHSMKHKPKDKPNLEPKTCELCGILVENSSVLKSHILRAHGISEKKGTAKTIPDNCIKCQKCKMLLNPDDVHNHVCQKNIKCPECGETFYNCKERANHKLEEHSEPQSCEICGKTFQTLGKLTSHLETHAEKVECPQCGLKVKHLQRHIDQKHVQDKRFKCSQCGKGFIQADLLKRHIDCIHLNARRYQCRYCDFRFNDSSNRNAHERKKHPNKTDKELAI